jgi:hypothetical protein
MGKFILKHVNNEKGNVVFIVAISFIGLLGMVGLAIDGGLLYMTKSHLHKTANAVVVSGAQELTNKKERVITVVDDVLKAHGEETSLKNIEVVMENKLSVDLEKAIKLNFVGIFGIEEVKVKAHASAELRPIGRAKGAAPLGIDERYIPEYSTIESQHPIKLKVDSSDNMSGSFGILALGGPGARTYEENLRTGYQQDLKVGDVVNTQTGNVAGPTRTAVQERVNNCPETTESIFSRNCSRVILILVYKRLQPDNQKLESVQITGFAYFYISQPMSGTDDSISGYFIKRAGKGFEEAGSVSRGAYKIRITE